MQNILVEIAMRLKEAPERAAELVLKRGETNDKLHQTLDTIKAREAEVAGQVAGERNSEGKPLYPNEQARQAEIARRLAQDASYQTLRAEADRLRQELRMVDAEAEQMGRRHRSDANMAYLVASLVGAGLKAEAEAVLAAYSAQGRPQAEEASRANGKQGGQKGNSRGNGLVEMAVEVLGAMPGRSPETVKALCKTPNGEITVFAKNGEGRKLAKAIGEVVTVKARKMEDSGNWFAVAVLQ